MEKPFEQIIRIIKQIPPGKVSSYGYVGMKAGYPRSARTVAWVLKHYSEKENLPWQRVLRQNGQIAISDPFGRELQKHLLESEGVAVSPENRVDMNLYGWI